MTTRCRATMDFMSDNSFQSSDEPPPFLGSWRRIYVAVLIYLAAIIGLFAAFGRAFTA